MKKSRAAMTEIWGGHPRTACCPVPHILGGSIPTSEPWGSKDDSYLMTQVEHAPHFTAKKVEDYRGECVGKLAGRKDALICPVLQGK